MRAHKKTFVEKVKDFFYIHGDLIKIVLFFLFIGALIYLAFIPNKWKRAANEKEIYRNEKLVIVGTNEAAQDFTHDKFHKPIVIKVWLVQRLSDTTQYAELSSYDDYQHWNITQEMWYSKGIGDTLHFDYIRKNRFFRINKK
jgi:hypothetical protein